MTMMVVLWVLDGSSNLGGLRNSSCFCIRLFAKRLKIGNLLLD